MAFILIMLAIMLFSIIITSYVTAPTKNVWYPCTYCERCNEVYTQAGMNPSVYLCPTCGNLTKTGYSFKVETDGSITKKKS